MKTKSPSVPVSGKNDTPRAYFCTLIAYCIENFSIFAAVIAVAALILGAASDDRELALRGLIALAVAAGPAALREILDDAKHPERIQ